MAQVPFVPVVFPLFGITADGKCACGVETCSRVGKHPRVAWGDIKLGDEVPLPEPGAGVGLKTGAAPKGSDVFVVDLDSEEALETFEELGGSWPTFTIATPRGWHVYFKHPGFPVKTSAGELAKGIDIRGEGGFVVAQGSPHRSGGVYRVCDSSVDELADAPPWLLEWLQRQPKQTETQHYPGDVVDPDERARRRELYASYLRETATPRGPAHRGQGDKILFDVVQRGAYDLALPVDDVLELVREHYDPRCSPQWGAELEERVHHKARDAKTTSTRPRAEPLPADLAHLAGGTPVPDLSFELSIPPGAGSLGERWGGWDAILLPPVYLLDGLIPEGKIVTFFAEGGSVKTWSALALAISVASGKPWLGRYHVKKGKVLYLDYEDGPFETGRRVRMLNGGEDVPDLGYLYGGPPIDQLELWKALAKKVLDEGIVFVVVDSLGAGMPGDADENTTAFAAGMKIAGRFTEVPGAKSPPTVLFVHHANKTGGMRGTSAARDQSDVVFKFEPVSETDSVKRMRMICDKPGPQKRPAPVNVELSDKGLTTFEDEGGDAIRNAEKPNELKSAIKLALQNGPMLMAALKERFGGRHALIVDAVKALTEAGEVVCIDPRKGVQLDNDDARRARVLAVAGTFNGSKAALADRAQVLEQDVDSLIQSGYIINSGKNGFVILKNS